MTETPHDLTSAERERLADKYMWKKGDLQIVSDGATETAKLLAEKMRGEGTSAPRQNKRTTKGDTG